MNAGHAIKPKLGVRVCNKVYPHGLPVTFWRSNRCDLDVRANEIVSIVGPSGCGKTTLLWSMSGLPSSRPARSPWTAQRSPGRTRTSASSSRKPICCLAQPRRQHQFPLRDQGHAARQAMDPASAAPRRAGRVRRSSRVNCRAACSSAAIVRALSLETVGAVDGRAVRRARQLYARGDEPAGRGDLAGCADHHRLHHPFDRRSHLPVRPRAWC